MPEHTFQPDSADHTRRPVSIRFVVFVLLGLYVAGYLGFRLRGEPSGYVDYDDTPAEHVRSMRWLWESDETAGYKIFSTVYWPCEMAEDWLIREVLG
jgi:hypothetical protein